MCVSSSRTSHWVRHASRSCVRQGALRHHVNEQSIQRARVGDNRSFLFELIPRGAKDTCFGRGVWVRVENPRDWSKPTSHQTFGDEAI